MNRTAEKTTGASRAAAPIAAVALAALLALGGGDALAQSSDGYETAPGYIGPNGFFVPEEREVVSGYGATAGDLPDTLAVDEGDGALTEFAGQKKKYDPGIIGGVLGGVKNAIFGD